MKGESLTNARTRQETEINVLKRVCNDKKRKQLQPGKSFVNIIQLKSYLSRQTLNFYSHETQNNYFCRRRFQGRSLAPVCIRSVPLLTTSECKKNQPLYKKKIVSECNK